MNVEKKIDNKLTTKNDILLDKPLHLPDIKSFKLIKNKQLL
jgi:hypothetical protein